MADSGRLAAFKFGSTTYNADDCLQSWDIADAIQDVVYQCNSYDKHARGTQNVSFSVSLALAKTDVTKVTALAPGTTGAFEAHPGGDAASNIEITATRGIVIQRNVTAPINGIIQADVVIALDDVTWTTAT